MCALVCFCFLFSCVLSVCVTVVHTHVRSVVCGEEDTAHTQKDDAVLWLWSEAFFSVCRENRLFVCV